jgi:tripartite-type tricarboxylate transporter receptor subunit TctC
VLAVNAKLPVKTLPEFIAWAKARNGDMSYASLGNGSSAHLTMALLLAEIGAKATHVPFNGSPPAAMAVAQGEVDATFIVAPALMAHVRSGKLRLLAVSSSQHPESLKDLPTLASVGLKNVESLAWNGLFVPTGTPEAVVQKINADVNAVLAEPATRAALDGQGLTPVGGSAADFRKLVAAESQRWGEVIRRLGIKID